MTNNAVWIVFLKEIGDNLRDRRTLLASLVYPLLGPLMLALLMGIVGNRVATQVDNSFPLPVAGAEHAPSLITFLEQNNVEILPAPLDPERAVREGEEEVILIIPEGYGAAFQAGQPATLRLVVDQSRQAASASVERARRLLTAYNQQLAALRLLARGISPSVINPIAIERVDVSTPQSQAANLLGIAPYFIVFSLFIGGMYLAIDSTTGERERGSLEPLLITPTPRWALVLGKMAASLLFTVVAVTETLVAFGLVPYLIPIQIAITLEPSVLLAIFLITLPIMLLAAGLQMVIASYASGTKEAQTYLSILILIPALPGMFLAFAPIRPELWTMLIPIFGQEILINQVMRGLAIEPMHLLVSSVITLLVALLLIALAVWLYDREDVLFRR